MDRKPFIDAYRDLNQGYLRLIESLSALRALSTVPLQHCSEIELMHRALEILADNQSLECGSIFLLQGERLNMVAGVRCRDGAADQSDAKPSFALGEGIVGRAAASGEMVRCEDCTADEKLLPCQPGKTAGVAFCSNVTVPIRSGEEVLGVLSVLHPRPRYFDQGHERSLRLFCDILGQLLTNIRLLHQMDTQVQQRTAQLQKALDTAEELRQRYEELAVIDELTQLHNRRFFFPEALAALSRALRHRQPFSILLLDVDHFKAVNDNFGHKVGDTVLQQVAKVLQEQTREGDILSRFGGEEFVLALPNTDRNGAMLLAERVRLAVKGRHWEAGTRHLVVTVSVGVSDLVEYEGADAHTRLDEMILQADQALYFGKQNGRDQVCSYAETECKL